jgi:hypothetical protein
MGLKENIDKEKQALMSTRRPYETAAFIIYSLLFLQQMFYLIRSLYFFAKNKTFFSLTNITSVGNLQAFFNRTVVVDSSKWIWVILAIAFLVLYYFLIYIFVWRYCKKRNLAKWTWTTLVVFGPGLFFMPAYMFYIIYVFREYVFKFIKTVVEEYKAFDLNKMAKQEEEILRIEEKEALEREIIRKAQEEEKAKEKKQKELEKQEKQEEKEE